MPSRVTASLRLLGLALLVIVVVEIAGGIVAILGLPAEWLLQQVGIDVPAFGGLSATVFAFYNGGMLLGAVLASRLLQSGMPTWFTFHGAVRGFLIASPLVLVNVIAAAQIIAGDGELPGAGWFVWAAILSLAIGLGEEALFRGALMDALDVQRRPQFAVLAGAVIFGLAHVVAVGAVADRPEEIANAAAVALMVGIPFGLIRVRTGSIAGPVLAHAAFDVVAIGAVGDVTLPDAESAQLVSAIVVAGLVSVGYLVWFHRTGGYRSSSSGA